MALDGKKLKKSLIEEFRKNKDVMVLIGLDEYTTEEIIAIESSTDGLTEEEAEIKLKERDEAAVNKYFQMLSDQIVKHIKNDAEVATTVASGIDCSVNEITHNGATTETGSGTGTVS